MAYALVNYFIGKKIPLARNKVFLYRTGIIINLAQLILLKYASFSIDPLIHLLIGSCGLIELLAMRELSRQSLGGLR